MGKRAYGYCGVLGAIVIFANLAIFSVITPDYNSFWQTISELNSKGSDNFLLMNVLYTVGLTLLAIYSLYYLAQEMISAKISGLLMLISFILLMIFNWFFPMNPELNIRTSEDLVHNNIITVVVVIFLLAQIFSIAYWSGKKDNKIKKLSIFAFVAALIFGLISLYSNIFKSELTNIAERGWMLVFLIYLFMTSSYLIKINRTKN